MLAAKDVEFGLAPFFNYTGHVKDFWWNRLIELKMESVDKYGFRHHVLTQHLIGKS